MSAETEIAPSTRWWGALSTFHRVDTAPSFRRQLIGKLSQFDGVLYVVSSILIQLLASNKQFHLPYIRFYRAMHYRVRLKNDPTPKM